MTVWDYHIFDIIKKFNSLIEQNFEFEVKNDLLLDCFNLLTLVLNAMIESMNNFFICLCRVMLPYFGSHLAPYSVTMNNVVSYVSSHVSVDELTLFSIREKITALNLS